MSAHTLSLLKACPSCGVDAELVERGEETCLGSLGYHDPNCVSGIFECPAGHRFVGTTQYRCSCGWTNVQECRISNHHLTRML
jgi:hypothetical protein